LRALRDVREWCPDRAALWWETNIPNMSPTDTSGVIFEPASPSPVGARAHG
jgi:hypothetical protein